MSGRIPEAYIEQVLARTDIVEVIGARVPLRRSGAEFAARCPFHEERTPSFTVSPVKQFYHCFGCGAHGTAIGFLMAHDRLGFPEAVRELASRAGLPPPEQDGPVRTAPDARLYAVLTAAERFYRAQLRRHPQAPRAVEYLKSRGLTGAIAAQFGLGYAPPGGSALTAALRQYPLDLLQAAGLVVPRDGRAVDKFRDRIVFPIRDERGRTVGFGGRTLGDAEPKYLNSPETAVFHKGRLLYHLDAVARLRPAPARLLVVEGYMDVIALAQAGIPQTVATLGTAATTEHLRRALRICPEVVFCFDGDAAGRRAAARAADTVLPELQDGREVRFLYLPAGEDPDSFVRRAGAGALLEQVAQARPLSAELFAQLRDGLDLRIEEHRARLLAKAGEWLRKLPLGSYRALLLGGVAELVGLPVTDIETHIRTAQRARRHGPTDRAVPRAHPVQLADRLAALLAAAPELAGELVGEQTLWCDAPDAVFLKRFAAELTAGRSAAMALERWRDSADGARLARALALTVPTLAPEAVRQELRAGLGRLRAQALGRPELLRGRRPADFDAEARRALGRRLRSGAGEAP